MIGKYEKLLTDFETRIRHLLLLCDKLKLENVRLKQQLRDEQEKAMRQEAAIRQLTDQYERLKFGGYLSTRENDIQQAKLRVNKLVREIDKCIALLNE